MSFSLLQISGWIPAVIFPLAGLLQLIKILREQSADGISAIAWIAFGFANISLYIYMEKYSSLQTIIGMLGQAIIDFTIAFLAVYYSKKSWLKEKNSYEKK
jgi:uncharacterized protein with PQ loop repeat